MEQRRLYTNLSAVSLQAKRDSSAQSASNTFHIDAAWFIIAARIILTLTLLVALTVLISWPAGWVEVRSIVEGMATMKFNTALGLALISIAGLFHTRVLPTGQPVSKLATVLFGLAAGIGLLTIVEHLLNLSPGIDTLFAADPASVALGNAPGRMSLATAIGITLLAVGKLLCSGRLYLVGGVLVISAGLLAISGMVVYTLNDLAHRGQDGFFSTLAIHTAMLLVMATAGFFFARFGRRKLSDENDCDAVSKLIRKSWPMATVIAATVVAGWLMTAFVTSNESKNVLRSARAEFENISNRLTREAQRRANQVVYGLKGARGVYASSKSVERKEFEAYVASRDLPGEFPGAIGMGFIQRVERSKLDAFIEAQRADDAPEFRVYALQPPVGTGDQLDDLYVINHVYPQEQNKEAWGLDVGSQSVRREAVERAVLTGESTITGRIDLVQDHKSLTGFLYYVPVYKNGTNPTTPEERLAALDGLVYSPIILEQAMFGVVDIADGGLDFEIFDGEEMTKHAQLYDHDNHLSDQTGRIDDLHYEGRLFVHRQQISVGGRTWTVATSTSPKFEAAIDYSTPIMIALSGWVLSVLLAIVVWSMAASRSRAMALAHGMTAELHASEHALRMAMQKADRLAEIARRTNNAVAITDTEGRIEWINQAFTQLFGYTHDEAAGQKTSELLRGENSGEEACLAIDSAVERGEGAVVEVINYAKDGTEMVLDTELVPLRDEAGHVNGFMKIQSDITARHQAQLELKTAALTDKLTGLPNRALLSDRLQLAIERSKRNEDYHFALLFLDFDRFKIINDSLGHDVGDMLLVEIANRLKKATRTCDSISRSVLDNTAARLGGDEFVVLLDGIKDIDDATLVGDRLLEAFKEPYQLGEHEVHSTASIGIVTSEVADPTAAGVLRDADTAMYEAKQAGKARYVVFDHSMRERLRDRLDIENDLRKAIDEGGLSMNYQPIVSLTTGVIESYEALLRWNHPVRGPIPADVFVPIAEETGLIIPLGDWTLREACRQYALWQEKLGEQASKSISVNLSRKQLLLPDLAERVDRALKETGVDPSKLHLEITERDVMDDAEASIKQLRALRSVSVKLDLDDFGTGHSSLACLHEFPVDLLKIDKTFVMSIDQGRDFTALVQAITQLAQNLNITVVAEGIETADQLLVLQSLGCELGQGYFFSKPMTAEEVLQFRMSTGHLPGQAA